MASKKCVNGVLFTFVLAVLFFVMFGIHFRHPQQFFIRQHKELNATRSQELNNIPSLFQWLIDISSGIGSWLSSDEGPLVTENPKPKPKPRPVVISPNLSSCHPSFKKTNIGLLNCCPPKPLSEEPFIDFQFPNPSSPVRVRRPVHLLDNDFIIKYGKALEIMKSLPYNDPRSFMRQADLHCIGCTGSYNQEQSNTILMIHRSWLFFPWHRMMIYFHERILASLIEDETFALPFWNWDAPEGMMMPDMFMNEPFLNVDRDKSHFPPKIADLQFSTDETGLNPDDQIATNLGFMYTQMVSGAKKTELFMGCPLKAGEAGHCNGPGTIESAPHNSLHTWVGSDLQPMRENMGVFYAAARDPIFYAHHSNIDHLWEVWQNLTESKANIVDPDWLDSNFFFHNEHKQLVRIKIRDVLNITNLGYNYQEVNLPWLNSRPKPSVDPTIARHMLNSMHNLNEIQFAANNYSSDFRPTGRTLATDVTVRVFRPKIQTKKNIEEVLVVNGIDVIDDMAVAFDIFVNAVNGISIGPESREFAGTFVNVPQGVTRVVNKDDVVMNRKINLKLGISELLEDLEANEDGSIWVTLVPRGGSGFNIIVDGIHIEHMV